MSTTHARTAFRPAQLFALLLGGLLLLTSTQAHAATVTLGSGTAVPGQSQVALPLSLTASSGEQVSALSVEVFYDPSLIQWHSVAVEPTTAALGKQVQANLLKPGHIRVILYGLDRQTLSSGTLAQVLLNVLASAPPGSTIFDLRNGQAADPNGTELSMGVSSGRLWITALSGASPTPDTTPPINIDPIPGAAPAVQIYSPARGSTVTNPVYLRFGATGATIRSGTAYSHLHIQLDKGVVWHVYNTKPFRLQDLKPGRHVIDMSLVDNVTHQRLPGSETYDYTVFWVK